MNEFQQIKYQRQIIYLISFIKYETLSITCCLCFNLQLDVNYFCLFKCKLILLKNSYLVKALKYSNKGFWLTLILP